MNGGSHQPPEVPELPVRDWPGFLRGLFPAILVGVLAGASVCAIQRMERFMYCGVPGGWIDPDMPIVDVALLPDYYMVCPDTEITYPDSESTP